MSQVQRSECGRHIVAVVGGAVAGSEIASRLAQQGVTVVVFEQNARPYGKIEDGLPRWHRALREKEYATIDRCMAHPLIHFVPLTRLGTDVDFLDLVNTWDFSAIVLASGAWRDRPLPMPGADEYDGKGLVYQNPFIYWFNHCEEPDYDGPRYGAPDGTLVVGGGLSSVDVAKVVTLENARRALARRGIHKSVEELERGGLRKNLAALGITWEELDLSGCRVFYRRRIEDMPLLEMPPGVTPEKRQRVEESRRKVASKATHEYCFTITPQCMPTELLVESGKVVGVRFVRTEVIDGKAVPTDDTFEQRAPLVISSIGSIPSLIPGVPMKWELYECTDEQIGLVKGFSTVFAAGNAVTGKGNIAISRKHGTQVAAYLGERVLGLAGGQQEAKSRSAEEIESTLKRVRERQQGIGYPEDYQAWMKQLKNRQSKAQVAT